MSVTGRCPHIEDRDRGLTDEARPHSAGTEAKPITAADPTGRLVHQ